MPAVPKRLFASAVLALGCLGAALVSIHLAASAKESVAAPRARAAEARAASVDLQPAQVAELRIELVQTHSFPVEKHAVGSISFDEDPAIVQAESALLSAA